jgi:hypothetical protein
VERWLSFQNVRIGLRFLRDLPSCLRNPLRIGEAQSLLRSRLRRRDSNFLAILRRGVFENPASPYLFLFRAAGCTLDDVRELVELEGIEGCLRRLFRAGIYLTVDEFKGRRPAVRGSQSLEVNPDALRNPGSKLHLAASSGGSRSTGTPVLFDLRFIRGCAVNALLHLDARGGAQWEKATWEVPGGGSRFRLVKYACFGAPPSRWFSQIDPSTPGLHPLYAWSMRAMRWGSLLAGVPIPPPVHAPLRDPEPVLEWVREVRALGRVPHIFTFPSSAAALCRLAESRRLSLDPLRFTLSGEPITEARLEMVRRAGARATARYGSVETGPIGYGCLTPTEPDDVHLLSDLHALVQAGADGGAAGLPEKGLLITSLHPQSPFVFLNASMGDEAEMETRVCPCPLHPLGWTVHLRRIRSYEKLTGGGMNFAGTDVIAVLEEALPGRFGGVPTDYQMLEEETETGQSVLRLLVHPRLGPMDPGEVVDFFLTSLGSGSTVNRLMETMWRESGLLRVERREPVATKAGKILHFHLMRKPGADA